MDFTYVVKVIELVSGDAVKEISVIGKRRANKVASGIEINLNHDEFMVEVEKVE
jgi:hypothetical protein